MWTDPGERRTFLLSCAFALVLCIAMPVFAQEAYYQAYSRHLALSYYDHPPMVAWLIRVGTALFGPGVFGVRFGTWLCACGLSALGLRLWRDFGGDAAGGTAWLRLRATMPIYAAYAFLATPDAPLCAAWAATMCALWRARGGALGWWLLAGFAAGVALLSKYSAVFLAVGGALVLLADPAMRRQLRRPGPWLGVLVAALTFLPVVWWNVQNDFESFRFQTGGRWQKARLGVHWLLQCVGGQFGVLHPLLAIVLPAAVWHGWRRARRGDTASLWLLAFGVPLPAFFLANAFAVQVKINWFLPACLPLVLLALRWWRGVAAGDAAARPWLAGTADRVFRRWNAGPVRMAMVWGLGALLVWCWPQWGGSSWNGWAPIAAAALRCGDELARGGTRVFWFGANYRDAAQLQRAFVLDGGAAAAAAVDRVLAENAIGDLALQFDHWEPPARHLGEDAVFVLPQAATRPDLIARVGAHFAQVELAETVTVRRFGAWTVMEAGIYRCRGYLGPHTPGDQGTSPSSK